MKVDVRRLSLSCGPSGGLTPSGSWLEGVVDEDREPPRHSIELDEGRCVRIFAAASGVEDLELELFEPGGAAITHANLGEPWVTFPVTGVFCAPRKGRYELGVRTHGGSGRYALAPWNR